MSDEGYPASNWEHTDSDHPSSHQNHAYNGSPYFPRESLDVPGVPLTPTKSASPPRSSVESPTRLNHMRWRDSVPQPAHSSSAFSPSEDGILDTSFDENVLRALCNLDCGVPLMLDRIKQSTASCKEVATFLRKRMEMEADYGRNLQKLARSTVEMYGQHDAKAGSFMLAWKQTLQLHENVAASHIKMATMLKEQIDELNKVIDNSERERKQTKDLAGRYERALQDAESATEKSKSRVEATAEELERVLIQKEGESLRDTGVQGRSPGGGHRTRVIGKAVAKGGMLLKGKNPGNIQRQADDIRQRMSAASDQYRKNMTDTQAIRQEYFNFQLPRILRALQSCLNDVDLGIQYHMIRYSFLFESTVLGDGTTLAPLNPEEAGLKAIAESIDNRGDFKTYMQNYAVAHNGSNWRGPRRDGPRDEGYLPPIAPLIQQMNSPNTSVSHVQDKGRPSFGVDLAEQLLRDDLEVPPIMVKCCEAIEKYGLHAQGIYRVGGTITKVKELRERLDKDMDTVNLDANEWSSEISVVTSVLKQWLRELPNPLMTFELHEEFLEAARVDNDRLRHIRLHERVNELPDPNYATLKYFMGHLHKIAEYEAENAMSVQNLAIVFGPTLFKQAQPGVNGNMTGMADAGLQNKARSSALCRSPIAN
ncbi:uncharacterized protein PHACADRAFT_32967 [Phanerochaete carnosa HHB-10118-sp]|uniref:Rho-GAP domain-containing protein n=1 Tax=Phanerochaete carnosa (strain HHB-10118-sp) TaxID=650164 RepID=K5VU79_PHACS|nr:uncharacterized protein PHACADRAFT_32967 [Phanerochaete carnosa HHB-10118-sp]EKM50139.1 hypothetical protein PHACADRAFT_32967 [Phanerochaete carnosa HHB-10118-sp]